MKKIILKIMSIPAVIVTVWIVMFGYEYFSTYFTYQEQPAYESVTEDLKLKSLPKDVLYSESYEGSRGESLVKYAYLADEVSPVLNEDIGRRTSNSLTEVMETKQEDGKKIDTLKTTFFSKPQFYQKGDTWHQIEVATTTAEVFSMSGAIPHIKRRELVENFTFAKPTFALTSTFYPNPDTESTSVDGFVNTDCQAGNASNDNGVDIYTGIIDVYFPPYVVICLIYRGFLLFDTSALPDSAPITSATLSVYIISIDNSNNDGSDTLNVVTSNPASNTALDPGDWAALGSTLQASAVDISSLVTSINSYYGFTLNSTGRGNISKTGITKFGLIEGHDLASNYAVVSYILVSSADVSGTSQDPKLEVVYTDTSFSFGLWFPF